MMAAVSVVRFLYGPKVRQTVFSLDTSIYDFPVKICLFKPSHAGIFWNEGSGMEEISEYISEMIR